MAKNGSNKEIGKRLEVAERRHDGLVSRTETRAVTLLSTTNKHSQEDKLARYFFPKQKSYRRISQPKTEQHHAPEKTEPVSNILPPPPRLTSRMMMISSTLPIG